MVMGSVGYLLMGVGFLVSWLVPVAGVLVMVTGAVATAIASETGLVPAELARSTPNGDDPASALQPSV